MPIIHNAVYYMIYTFMLRINLQIEDDIFKKNKFNTFSMDAVTRPLQEEFFKI